MPVVLRAPVNNAEDLPITLTFTWEYTDLSRPVTGAKIYLKRNDESWREVMTLGSQQVQVTLTNELAYESLYEWQVIPFNDIAAAKNNMVFSFTTGEYVEIPQRPLPVTLLTPPNNSLGLGYTPTFTWEFAESLIAITNLRFYIRADGQPWGNGIELNVKDETYTITTPLSDDTRYFWRVIPSNNAGNATGNMEFTFTTVENPNRPPPVVLLEPKDGDIDVDVDITLKWEFPSGSANVPINTGVFGTPLLEGDLMGNEQNPPTPL
jgi:hypothetical protein